MGLRRFSPLPCYSWRTSSCCAALWVGLAVGRSVDFTSSLHFTLYHRHRINYFLCAHPHPITESLGCSGQDRFSFCHNYEVEEEKVVSSCPRVYAWRMTLLLRLWLSSGDVLEIMLLVAACPQRSTKMPLLGMPPEQKEEEEKDEETVTPTLWTTYQLITRNTAP